ncbi:2268_t:CDS:2, partial [Ambispora gerdemannii]
MSTQFEGFKKHLDPDDLSLISILQFRRNKDDLHTIKIMNIRWNIGKYFARGLSLASDEIGDREEVGLRCQNNHLSDPAMFGLQQTQNEEVVKFWLDVDNENAELRIKQTQLQFVVDRSISNNKAHDLIEEQKLGFISKRTLDHDSENDEKLRSKRVRGPVNNAEETVIEDEEKITQEGKWTLTPEKFLCHSFLIDPDDKNYIQQGVFTCEELSEIKNFDKKALLLMPNDLLGYLNSFRKSNTSDLRELIFRSDQAFDRSKDFDLDWIRCCYNNSVLEYEARHLAKEHLEAWIMLHAWSFIDKAFFDIDGMEIVRGESSSYASSNRKNAQRVLASTTSLKRKLMGRRGDLIIRKWHTEYGCSEAGKIFEGNNDTKIIKEGGLKMPKMLRDMFNDLCEAMEMREDKIRKLETIGFIIA